MECPTCSLPPVNAGGFGAGDELAGAHLTIKPRTPALKDLWTSSEAASLPLSCPCMTESVVLLMLRTQVGVGCGVTCPHSSPGSCLRHGAFPSATALFAFPLALDSDGFSWDGLRGLSKLSSMLGVWSHCTLCPATPAHSTMGMWPSLEHLGKPSGCCPAWALGARRAQNREDWS